MFVFSFFLIIIITTLRKAMSQHAANQESKQANPTEAEGTSVAFGSREMQSFTNSNELTFTGQPRKLRRGLCHKGSKYC